MNNSTFSDILTCYGLAAIADETVDLLDISASDMREECEAALRAGYEAEVLYASWSYEGNSESTQFIFFPQQGRGGACCGGSTDWTDCTGLDDLESRWLSRGTENDAWSE